MKQYLIDAFSDKIFGGNPAAVCILEQWISDRLMQHIAMENNLSETAFALKEGAHYHLRWFTPSHEIELCGHATLATACVLFRFYEPQAQSLHFQTRSGMLEARRSGDAYEIDLLAYTLKPVELSEQMLELIGTRPLEAVIGRDLLCVLESEEAVRSYQPDMQKLLLLDGLLLHITAPGTEHDCISRSFAPKVGVPEDPVCGSGHCHIIPYWQQRTGKTEIRACAASPRGGELLCRQQGDRIYLKGNAALYAIAELFLEGV